MGLGQNSESPLLVKVSDVLFLSYLDRQEIGMMLVEVDFTSFVPPFEASTDHLNLLADVFVKALSRNNANNAGGGAHSTQLFHLLLPSLCCAFLDSLLLGRDCLAKRAVANTGVKGDALLQDDGFAVGAAFVLRVFGLNRDFQSLHWFQTEINDSDMTTGQARAAAGLPFFTDSNQTLESNSILFASLCHQSCLLFCKPFSTTSASLNHESSETLSVNHYKSI